MPLLLGSFYREFDPDKDKLNLIKHGLSLADSVGFDFTSCQIELSKSSKPHELRYVATGFMSRTRDMSGSIARGLSGCIVISKEIIDALGSIHARTETDAISNSI